MGSATGKRKRRAGRLTFARRQARPPWRLPPLCPGRQANRADHLLSHQSPTCLSARPTPLAFLLCLAEPCWNFSSKQGALKPEVIKMAARITGGRVGTSATRTPPYKKSTQAPARFLCQRAGPTRIDQAPPPLGGRVRLPNAIEAPSPPSAARRHVRLCRMRLSKCPNLSGAQIPYAARPWPAPAHVAGFWVSFCRPG